MGSSGVEYRSGGGSPQGFDSSTLRHLEHPSRNDDAQTRLRLRPRKGVMRDNCVLFVRTSWGVIHSLG